MHRMQSTPHNGSLLRKGDGEMVKKLYLEDSYMRETKAAITGVVGPKEVELDQTVFFPTGGGQPSDTGTIIFNGSSYRVVETKKPSRPKELQSQKLEDVERVIHVLDREPDLRDGDTISASLDWSRRYRSMQLHTAMHTIDGIAIKKFRGTYTGGSIHDKQEYRRGDLKVPVDWYAHMDYDFISDFNPEIASTILKQAQDVINKSIGVTVDFISREDALKIPDLVRTETGKILLGKLQTVRIVRIGDFDVQMDGGTHVANTSEIGNLELIDTVNKGVGQKRIVFTSR